MAILTRYPDDWAVPRDWHMQGATVLIRVESLSALAREFDDAGFVGVGNKLRDFAAERAPKVAREVCGA